MTYAMSDIHGCYDEYVKMLKKINFTDKDRLFALGDVVDVGKSPAKVLHDMSMRANVIPIMGNHEYVAHEMLSKLFVELKNTDISKLPPEEANTLAWEVAEWEKIGGKSTIDDFQRLPPDERVFLIEYISELSLYEIVKVKGKTYIMTHAGLPNGATSKNLDQFDAYDFFMASVDYEKRYFSDDVYMVTGHFPTYVIDENCRGKIYRMNNHLAIDVGAGYGGGLGCICLDTLEEFYV